jgi:uncharacterized membrane protein YczE
VVLEDKDIVQIDATVIAGVLILLSLSLVENPASAIANWINLIKNVLIMIIIAPFAYSAFNVISISIENDFTQDEMEEKKGFSLILMRTGFAYIIVTIAVFIIFPFIYTTFLQ